MDITIKSNGTDGSRYEIMIFVTGKDTGRVRILTWPPGASHAAPPTSDNDAEIEGIRASQDGSRLVCRAKVFGHPTLKITIGGSEVTVEIKVFIGGSTNVYPLDAAEAKRVRAFIANANFPPLA